MIGHLDNRQAPLFYNFCLESHVPQDHLLRKVAGALDLSDVRRKLAPFYSAMGRPSLARNLLIASWWHATRGMAPHGAIVT